MPTKLIQPSIILGLVIALIIAVSTCNSQKEGKENAEAKVEYLTQTIDSVTNKFGQIVAEQKVALTNSEKELKNLSAEIFDLKKRDERQIKEVQALVRVVQKLSLDTPIVIPYIIRDTITGNTDTLVAKSKVVIPPQPFADSTQNYNIAGTVLLNGVRIDKLEIPDTLSIRVADKKTGWFKPKETVVQAIHSNALVKTTGMNSMVLKHKTNAWNRWIKPSLAAIAAVFITAKVTK